MTAENVLKCRACWQCKVAAQDQPTCEHCGADNPWGNRSSNQSASPAWYDEPCPHCKTRLNGECDVTLRAEIERLTTERNEAWATLAALARALPCVPDEKAKADDPLAHLRWICIHCTTVCGIDDEICLGCRKPRYPLLRAQKTSPDWDAATKRAVYAQPKAEDYVAGPEATLEQVMDVVAERAVADVDELRCQARSPDSGQERCDLNAGHDGSHKITRGFVFSKWRADPRPAVIPRDSHGHAIGHPQDCRINNGFDMTCDCGAESET